MKLTLSVLEIVPPKWSDFILTSDIPDSKTDVLILHCFYVKPCKKNRYSHFQ